jgi:hypothetical protein
MRMLAVLAAICLTLSSCGPSQQELESKRAEAQAQMEAKREAQKLNLTNAIKSSQAFSGVFVDNRSGQSYAFNIRFTYFDENTGFIVGEMWWSQSGAVKQIEGLFLDKMLTFQTTQILSTGGGADSSLGHIYTFNVADNNQIQGSWKRIYKIPLSGLLGDSDAKEETNGSVSFSIGNNQGQKLGNILTQISSPSNRSSLLSYCSGGSAKRNITTWGNKSFDATCDDVKKRFTTFNESIETMQYGYYSADSSNTLIIVCGGVSVATVSSPGGQVFSKASAISVSDKPQPCFYKVVQVALN